MNKYLRTISQSLLSAALVSNIIPVQIMAEEVDNYPTEKTETVYCVLNEDGTPSSTIVSNWIHDEDGICNVKENLQLSNVESTKGDVTPNVEGNIYTWNTPEKDVYYQGEANKSAPVKVNVKYYLNNKEMDAKDLEGKKGHLKCIISLNPTITKTVSYGNSLVDIHPAYLCGGALILNSESCKNLTVSQGEVIQQEDASIISFVAVPGLKASLEQMGLEKVVDSYHMEDEIVIEGDVNECEIKTLVMGMTNEFDFDSLNSIDTLSELTGGIDQLVNASNQIEDGSKQLFDGTSELIEKSEPLTSAYPQINRLADSTKELADGTNELKNATISYTQGVSSLDAGNKMLYGITDGILLAKKGVSTSSASQVSLVDGTKALENGLKQLNEQVGTLNVEQLGSAIQMTKVQLESLDSILTSSKQSLSSLQNDLESAKQSMESLQNAMTSLQQVLAGIDQVVNTDNQIIASDQQKVYEINAKIDEINVQIDTLNATKATEYNSLLSSIQILSSAKASLNDENDPDGVQRASIDTQISTMQALLPDTSSIAKFEHIDSLDQLQTLTVLEQQLNQILTGIGNALKNPNSEMNKSMKDATDQINNMDTYLHGEKGAFYCVGVLENILNQTSMAGLSEENLKALQNGVSQLYEGSKQLSNGAKTLDQGLQTLYEQSKVGIDQVNAGSLQLASYNEALVNGISSLDAGAQELYSNQDMFYQMADGLQQLSAAFTQLNDGAKELSDGCQKFNAEGMQVLKQKVDLTTGELDALVDLFNQIIELNNENRDFIGAPENAHVTTRYIFRIE